MILTVHQLLFLILDAGVVFGLSKPLSNGRSVTPGISMVALSFYAKLQGSTVVGFDIESTQPRSNVLEKSVARRLKWVQGNV